MFVLDPTGSSSGSSGSQSQFRKNLSYFGKLGLYFVCVRVAYVFFSGSTSNAIEGGSDNNSSIDSNPSSSNQK